MLWIVHQVSQRREPSQCPHPWETWCTIYNLFDSWQAFAFFLCRDIIDKVESTIQLWNDAKEAKFWLPWPTVCQGLEESDFRAYAKACQTFKRTDLERGFRIHINRRQIAAFFVHVNDLTHVLSSCEWLDPCAKFMWMTWPMYWVRLSGLTQVLSSCEWLDPCAKFMWVAWTMC